jgi:hypothetical protein
MSFMCSAVNEFGSIDSVAIMNSGQGYTSIPSIAVEDPDCLCALRVFQNLQFGTDI